MSGGCRCRPISVKRNLKMEADVVVSECTDFFSLSITLYCLPLMLVNKVEHYRVVAY